MSVGGCGCGGDGGSGEDVMRIQDEVMENDVVKELMSVEGQVNANLRGKRWDMHM